MGCSLLHSRFSVQRFREVRVKPLHRRRAAPAGQRRSQQGVRDGAHVDVFEFAADRHAAREPRHAQAARLERLAEHVRGGLALVGEVGREDHFLHHAVGGALDQLVRRRCRRADAVERAQPPHQHEVQAAVAAGPLEHDLVGRASRPRTAARVARVIEADGADLAPR